MFVHALDDRAISRSVLAIAKELSEMGVDVQLIAATLTASASPPAWVAVENLDIGRRRTATALPRLASVIRKMHPDVLFGHGNGPNRAALLARLLFRLPVRVVAVEHTHYSTFYPRRKLRDLLTGRLYPLAERIAGVSLGVIDDLERRFPGVRGKTTVLPSPGPRLSELRALAAQPISNVVQADDRPRVICSVGNIVPRKGQDTLVSALPRVRDVVGDVRLVLVGRPDDEKFVQRLEHLAASLGVERFVSFVGYQPNPLTIVARSDVFALASTTEGFGISLVEAMACRVPVVSTNCPAGPSYVLENGRCGLLVNVGDPTNMADALIRVLQDATLRRELVARGEQRAAQFEPQVVAAQYLEVANTCSRDP